MRSGSDDYVPGGDVAIRLIPDLLSRGTATVFKGNRLPLVTVCYQSYGRLLKEMLMYIDQWNGSEGKSTKSRLLLAGILFSRGERRIAELESIVAVLKKEKVDRELVDSVDDRLFNLEGEVREVEHAVYHQGG